ncbi:alpha/beta-hydrolase [Punctularia strigosozonata HHB-11173 SS5]|uniref:alpha/beta-hydrolase n=1 Tax=Punctularia strigosozonata (strain HHB-11173) TaxID=741275 RepID=UPI000441857D|nr:alpha/beta-hydrolase [Punctularia strigosozonata HHB-11173 SS5]EIN12044.1 alpha/beta-hydrolase [Punctularia strigosozonata HHB-11173 SS5]
MPEYRRQPLKGIFLFYQLFTTLLFRVPTWALISLYPKWRPRPSWSITRCIYIRLWRHLFHVGNKVGKLGKTPDHLAIVSGIGVKGIWVEPAPELIVGEVKEWADVAQIEPIRLPGYWLDKSGSDTKPGEPPAPGEKVVYALHGGAYVSLSANPADPTANIAKGLLQHCDHVRRVFSLEYRLSVGPPYDPAHPFPTALVDAVSGYNYLINVVGLKPEDIIVEGDSAGGNLALALSRYLIENRTHASVPAPPGALILMSPWCDLSKSHHSPESSTFKNANSDYLSMHDTPPDRLFYPVRAFIGPHDPSWLDANRYISPASLNLNPLGPDNKGLFSGFPRTFIAAGGAEVLLDQIRTLKDRMVGDLGNAVTYSEAPDGVHDYACFEWHEPERSETFIQISKWLQSPLSSVS